MITGHFLAFVQELGDGEFKGRVRGRVNFKFYLFQTSLFYLGTEIRNFPKHLD